MKTAEEWHGIKPDRLPDKCVFKMFSLAEIKQIQLDAFKAGMTEAASIGSGMNKGKPDSVRDYYGHGIEQFKEAILSARDNLKEI